MPAPFHRNRLRLGALATAVGTLVATASAQAAGMVLGELPSLLEQRERMPAEFRTHLFGSPLTVRVELDGRYLGDAEVVLHEDNRVQVLAFTEAHESPWPETERMRWAEQLAEPMPLGVCGSDCRGLTALHYSLSNSLLTLLTPTGAQAEERYIALPEGGSHGLIVRSSLAVHAGQNQQTAARYSAELRGSIGRWSTVGSYQYYAQAASREHYLSAFYAQRELGDHFVRAGYFLPTFEGIIRQPRAPGTQNDTTLGVMFGSSDVLLADTRSPSVYPVYVTASREGVVEIYRDGRLLSTQGVKPGIQEIDTRRLPGGIYDVELRVMADGQEASREAASIHKPSRWVDPTRRWRYSLFAGQQQRPLDSSDLQDKQGAAVGAVVNYLLHPRAVAGATAQKIAGREAVGVSLDWQATTALSTYTNFYTSSDAGRGMDLQAMYRYRAGSVVANHGRSWVEHRQRIIPGDGSLPRWHTSGGWQDSTALSFTHRFSHRDHANVRIARTSGYTRGTGLDVSYGRRETLFGRHDVNWQVSAYDRPGSLATQYRRQRGIDLTVSLSLGSHGRSYGGSLGSRTGESGRRDSYVTASAAQQWEGRYVRSVNGMVTADSTGMGAGAGMYLQSPLLEGDVQLNRGSSDGRISGSANLESTAVFGGGHVAVIGQGRSGSLETGMIVDVRSDFPEAELRADDSLGGGVMLRPGRNFVPVNPYRAGHVQFDFHGRHAPAAALQPSTVRYHLNKGGVTHTTLDVLRTYTVMGQVIDADGNGVRGVHVINHAGRTVSQDDGFFTLELSARAPVVQMQYPNQVSCTLTLEEEQYPREGDLLMVGGMGCPPAWAADPSSTDASLQRNR
ncbi:TcfC E-set like domain-containing protein [Stenotrophomonas maltophilia]|uniref:TcfC E-set like domain-containing protein n=1 Tax=Stenotrophomonas forensis TaxID=2871169 RepID=UPI0018D4A9B1|nr:TcfC E-set like domain-containing protein [Stenotrophomonas maltophilia]MBH1600224.1 TcfC E-set like domain-containing protein [Stenotrophomonas maltophilia]